MATSDGSGQFLSGLVARIVEIVGEQAGQTLFRYTAREEGKQMASDARDLTVSALVESAAKLLSLEMEVVNVDDQRLRIRAGPMPRGVGDPIQNIIVGLLEGFMLMRTRHKAFATSTSPGKEAHELLIEVEAVLP